MTADPAFIVLVPAFAVVTVGPKVSDWFRARRIIRDQRQGLRIVDRAVADRRVAGGAR